MDDQKRFLSYICPTCRQSVVVERSLFALAAAPTKIPCPCGKSALHIEFMGERVKIEAPCLYCGTEHIVSCTPEAFMGEKPLAFACSASGLDCCYVGEEGAVYAATIRLEQAIHKMQENGEEKGTFLDEMVMHEVLSELKEIAGRSGVACTCGSKQWEMKVGYSSVDLSCNQCGGHIRIPAAISEDIDDICCKYTVEIHGAKKD